MRSPDHPSLFPSLPNTAESQNTVVDTPNSYLAYGKRDEVKRLFVEIGMYCCEMWMHANFAKHIEIEIRCSK